MIPKRLAITECRKKGRERGRKKGRREGRERGRKRGRKASEGERERGREEGRVRIAGKGAKEKRERKGRRKGSEGERALLASVVHVARALYMNVTQDVAVGLSCILCTPTLDYSEYHARLRSIY